VNRKATICQAAGMLAIVSALVLAAVAFSELPSESDSPRSLPIACVNNLKQIGLGFKTWALDHNDHFTFSESTNGGGTMEFCATDTNGFDRDAPLHFQIMSNELSTTPVILVCPKENVTYRMRSGTNFINAHPQTPR
jgi:hypothetical protein